MDFTCGGEAANTLSGCSLRKSITSLARKLKAYTEPSLRVCDELGYLALD
jgi:hypothetical protein